ncbi:aldo-keto reductase family protein [Robbsia andropogonis]|uniref:hypothetical protein n=1 Tax=Robbsia andropogonis TaxID=28092 RepID=UPI0012F7B6B7|nr:hypothetical protein [Robbsia andropogonis]MCP1119346.1 hypothetical protein [Robbsia andropogonis]MCP1129186.1 hypothetical protein [Robbsia andropogonis]
MTASRCFYGENIGAQYFLMHKIADLIGYHSPRWHYPHPCAKSSEGFYLVQVYVVDVLGAVATEHNASRAQIARAWLLVQKGWIVPISGTKKQIRLAEILGGAIRELRAEDLIESNRESAKIQIEGERLPEAFPKMTGL